MRSILSIPSVYRLFGWLLGASRGRELYVRRYVRAAAGDRVLDIGCGPGSILPHLPAVDYVGFDASPTYVAAARQRFANRPHTRFACERVGDKTLEQPSSFDLVLATAILHHLDDGEAGQLFALARSALAPGGRLVTLDPCIVDPQPAVARWMIRRDRGTFVRTPEQYVAHAREAFDDVRWEVRHDLLRIPYTHAIMTCTR